MTKLCSRWRPITTSGFVLKMYRYRCLHSCLVILYHFQSLTFQKYHICEVYVLAAKALSSKVLWIRITTHVRLSVERSRRLRASATRRRSSSKYDAEFQDSDRWTSVAILKSTRWRTCSQCSRRSTGVMWSQRWVPVTRRAAAFWTDCNRLISPWLQIIDDLDKLVVVQEGNKQSRWLEGCC